MTNEIATWREISEASRALAKRFELASALVV